MLAAAVSRRSFVFIFGFLSTDLVRRFIVISC
jgi:hypothetical protein